MSKSIYTHKHHIIPRHAGGSDDPSNLKELTTEEHALAHKKLFFIYGRWQDEIAYQALSGQIGNEEAIRLAGLKANVGRKATDETKRKMSETRTGKDNGFYGMKHTQKSIKKMRKSSTGKKHTEETKKKMGNSRMGNQNAKGNKHTEETKKKMREAHKRRLESKIC